MKIEKDFDGRGLGIISGIITWGLVYIVFFMR